MRQRRVGINSRITSILLACLLSAAGMVVFITFEPEIACGGKVFYVGSGPGNNSSTIVGGINLANDGDTVFVYSGTYVENLVIDKSINLTGEDRNTTIINGNGGCAVYIDSTSWVNVTGFTITNGEPGILIFSSLFITIQGNEIYNNEKNGIESQYSSNNNYIDNIVHDQLKSAGGGSGFFFAGCPFSNNRVIGNIVYDNEGNGIHLEDGTSVDAFVFWNNNINNNTVYNNTNGISIDQGLDNFVIDNVVHHNGLGSINPRGGIYITRSQNNIVIGNIVHNNKEGIVLVYSTPSLPLTNNTITKNSVYNNNIGIRLRDAQTNTFIDNSIFNNNYSVHIDSWVDPNLCFSNDFIDCSLSNAAITHVYMENSTDINFINCTISNSKNEDFNLTDGSSALLLNTTFDKTKVYYGDALSNLTVKWFMHTHVIYSSGNPVAGAEVQINDSFGANILNDSADSQGWIRWTVITEYVEQDLNGDHIGDRMYFTPHNATATDGMLRGYAYPEPFMDRSRVVLIILGDYSVLNLKPGWNLISLPRIQPDTDPRTILQPIEGDYDAVLWYNITDADDHWKHNHILKPSELNDLNELNHIMGFWIHVTSSKGTKLVVFGYVPSSNQSISLHQGWNIMGYPSLTNHNRTAGLNNIDFGTDVDSIWTWDGAKQKWEAVGGTDYFEIGKGYWMYSNVEKVWNVPL